MCVSRGTAFYTVIDTTHDKENMLVQKLSKDRQKKHIFIPCAIFFKNSLGVCLNKVFSLQFSSLERKKPPYTHFMIWHPRACLRSEM